MDIFFSHPLKYEKFTAAGMSARSCRGGFTLLEVMICLALVASLLVTLIYTLNYHLGVADRQVIMTTATVLAKKKMHEALNNPAGGQGIFERPYEDYYYETTIRDSDLTGMVEIDVTVRNNKDEVSLSQLIEKKNEKL